MTPAALDMALAPRRDPPRRHRWIELDVGTFHLVEQGEGPAILFCHGFPDTAETWREPMRDVAEAGYRALALDMRGYGNSFAPEAVELYSALHTVGDLVGILGALGIETAVLVGHDWGADVAQRAMVLRPDRFVALVSLSIPIAPRGAVSFYGSLCDVRLGDRFYAFDSMKPDADERYAPAARTIPSILYWLSASPPPDERWDPSDPARHMLRPSPVAIPGWAGADYVRHTVEAFARTDFRGGLNYYRAAQASFDLMAAFKDVKIRQPSLYIWGAADGLCQMFHPVPPTLHDLQHDAPGLIDVVRLDDVGHWIQHEASERFCAELLRFLAATGTALATGATPLPPLADRISSEPTLARTEFPMALDASIRAGDLAAASDDLRGGGDVNRRAADGLTPLMIASGLGQAQMAALLLTAGADVLALEPRAGASALHKAALSGKPDVVALLLDHGAFIDGQTPILGHTALMDAVIYKHLDVVGLLLTRGARTSIRNHWNETALDLARRDGLDAIAGLIEAKDAADAAAIRSQALVPAVKAGDLDAVGRLVAAGAPVDARLPMVGSPDDDYTPLALAAREGHAAVVRLLLEAGADPRRTIGLFAGTALHEASYFGHANVVRVMTRRHERPGTRPAELDAQGALNGMTPLHDAVWHGHAEAARVLVEAGARVDLRTHAGLTARELAVHNGYGELAEWLGEAERAAAVGRSPHRNSRTPEAPS